MADERAVGGLLWARALVLSVVAWTTGALAHVEADGALPGPVTVLALVLGGAALAAPLLRRPASTLRTCLLLVVGQQGVHLALSLTAGHAHEGHGAAGMPGMSGGPLHHPGMLAAHVLAAAACGWWLARGERALWVVLGLAGRTWSPVLDRVLGLLDVLRRVLLVVRAAEGTGPLPRPWHHHDPRALWTPVLHLPARGASRRGPPTATAVA